MRKDPERLARLIHQVNNLLGVIQIQAAVARQTGGEAALVQALDVIEAAGRKTEIVVRESATDNGGLESQHD